MGFGDREKLLMTATALALIPAPAFVAPEVVGEATLIRTAVTGDRGSIEARQPIHRNEKIRTSKSGLGEFRFRDGTKLAVGWGSVVTVDRFVFDDADTAKKITIRAAKGTFRWISGKSKSTAYEIVTPAGTIGVRGTKFEFSVDGSGTTAVVMLSGQARFCTHRGWMVPCAASAMPLSPDRTGRRSPSAPAGACCHPSATRRPCRS